MSWNCRIRGSHLRPNDRTHPSYKGRPLKQTYTADLVCFDKIIVELKAVSAITDEHRAQIHNLVLGGKRRVSRFPERNEASAF